MITIYFFGGYLSNQKDVDAWKQSAEQSGVTVNAYPYPVGASAGDPLEKWFRSKLIARDIITTIPEQNIIIVGHSSGCAIANDVAQATIHLGYNRFTLIALDGFCPNTDLLALPNTKVWSAYYHGDDGSAEVSLNYDSLQERAGKNFNAYKAKVREKWPLHFSLVNLNVSDDYDTLVEGYHECNANLVVLGLDAFNIAKSKI